MTSAASGDDSAPRSDRELIALHVDGDPDAFGELFGRHRDRLWAVALRTLGNPEDAADALQDAMVSAFRRASSYRGEAAVTTWLHRVVVNACLDRVRREAVRATEPLPEDRSERIAAARDEIAEHQTAMDVTSALNTLSFEQRAALVLVDMEGYSVDDAAKVLGVAPGTIKSRCARGRAKLLPLVRHLRGDGESVAEHAASTAGGERPPTGGAPARDHRPVTAGGNQRAATDVASQTGSVPRTADGGDHP